VPALASSRQSRLERVLIPKTNQPTVLSDLIHMHRFHDEAIQPSRL
jgi:hypothetical protein